MDHVEAELKRRRHPRFTLTQAWQGDLKTCDDVLIEECRDSGIWISSARSAPDGELLTLAVLDAPEVVDLRVRVAACRPATQHGVMAHRIRLEPDAAPDDQLARMRWRQAPAVLWRSAPVRVVELSRVGCLFESRTAVSPGEIGVLRVDAPSRVLVDGARAVWCRMREGAAVYCVGVELLPTMREVQAAGEGSLRGAVAGLGLAFGA